MSPLLKKSKGISDDKYNLIKYCTMSGIFAFIIMCIIFFFHDNTLLLGENTVLRMDLYHQYCPLYAEVYDRIISGDSIVYSWTSGLGGNFLGNFFNYCSSPFAFVMFLFGHENIPEAIAFMILLKAVFASVAFTYYINKSNNEVRKESIVFGLFYAFSAYFVAFSWNIMWLDAFAFFPLVILGIERIIQYNKPLTYIIAMSMTMITNYYLAYMVCILSVMYFIYFYFGRYEFSSKIFKPAQPVVITQDNTQLSTDADKTEVNESEAEIESFGSNNTEPDINCISSDDSTTPENAAETLTENVSDCSEESSFTELITETSQDNITGKTAKHKFKDNRFWVTGWTFALSSVLCFCLAAFALIPIAYCLQSSSATGGSMPKDYKQYFDIFTFIANHLPGIEPTIRSSGDNVIPNVYCGLLTVILLPLYFFSSKIPGKQKIVSAILLMACLIGFTLNYFNFIWHGFHMPNDLPYRWSFAYSFFLLIIAYKAYRNINEFSNKALIGVGFAVMCFVVLVEKLDIPNADELTILLSVIFTILYLAILGMMKSPRYKKNAIISLLFFTVILEIVVSDTPKIVMQQPKDNYASDYPYYQEISDKVEADDKELFYRTELSKLRARMDPSWYGYNGTSTFTSMAYEHTAKMVRKLGVFGNNINSYTYYPQTPIFNSFFNIKYIYDNMNFIETNYPDDNSNENQEINSETLNSDSVGFTETQGLTESTLSDNSSEIIPESIIDPSDDNKVFIEGDNYIDLYTAKDSNEDFEAFEYNYFLPLMFSVNRDVTEWDYSMANPFEVQNSLMKSATGIDDILIPVDATSFDADNIKPVNISTINSTNTFTVSKTTTGKVGEATVYLVPEQCGNYYIFVGGSTLQSLNIEVGDLVYNYVTSSISSFILDVGYLDSSDEIKVTYKLSDSTNSANVTFKAAVLDAEKFEEAYDKILSNGIIELESFDETELSGTITVNNDNALLWTSIPYDEGWNIYVDGELMSYTKVNDDTGAVTEEGDIVSVGNGVIGIKIAPGTHQIKLEYKPGGLSAGLMLTAVGLFAVALILIYKFWLSKFFDKKNLTPVFFRKPDYYND